MSSSATLKLSVDRATGKRTITIHYDSDADALPHEHEAAHKELVEKLFEGGIAKPGDTILIEREATGQTGEVRLGEQQAEKEAARHRG